MLADRFEGKRLNSPNDLVYRSDGALFFTDPPFGLPKFFDDRRKELPFSGVYALVKGKLGLVDPGARRDPTGSRFRPTRSTSTWGTGTTRRRSSCGTRCGPTGRVASGQVFFDMTGTPGEDAIDGIKVDEKGNLYVSGPGGLWILSPSGKHLGTILAPEAPAQLRLGGRGRQDALPLRAELALSDEAQRGRRAALIARDRRAA